MKKTTNKKKFKKEKLILVEQLNNYLKDIQKSIKDFKKKKLKHLKEKGNVSDLDYFEEQIVKKVTNFKSFLNSEKEFLGTMSGLQYYALICMKDIKK